MSTPGRKRRVISLDQKKIEASVGKTSEDLGKQFDLPSSSIRNILGDKAAILKMIEEGEEAKRVRLEKAKYEDLEKAMLQWFREARSENVSMSGEILKTKAMDLAVLLAVDAFKASEGWLGNFKHRHSIVFKENQGEAGEIDMLAFGNWQQDVLLKAISHFSADDVFNADETGLFWQLLPNKTLAFKGERCTAGKKSKVRVTVLVAANMTGTEKLPLLVIGKSAKPGCFKGKEVPLSYKANRKAWMTADLFEEWLEQWDRKLKRDGRRILLVLDNFSGHTKIPLDQITLLFLPPNTTAASQPCDQGIIQNVKVHYRRFLLRKRIDVFDAKIDYKMNLFKALQFLRRSWSDVKLETNANCFKKAGFIKHVEVVISSSILSTVKIFSHSIQPTESAEDADAMYNELMAELDEEVQETGREEDEELNTLWSELQQMNLPEGTLQEYLGVDDQLTFGGSRSLAEIAEEVSNVNVEEPEGESETDVMEIEEEPQPVTSREAAEALNVLQRYADVNANPEIQLLCDKVDNVLAKERIKLMKQKKLLNYFAPNQ